ncbi:MAG TPA: S1 RNA-binding domain-containing protein [Candidatus Atribacteria bacterium]|uniref:S1 RNA-binding domain-containing protein n=1 Tax=Candidatus Sordicultor fermentans TaxID=1953203 RepID=UPI002A31D26E|nr:S1 RNA-binding domain-containing protein [Atribacterota bacterium]HOA98753.1 S1 RNA-binding domain-containing protein [Candidatus Atribacteria bacterium]MDI9607036.1 S1 RNA-binding domain-containing protein [Atribacterota bacterium]MDY0134498.1 S1 RNA-binding domain-containing protein [Atribacterota bacterium]HOQ51062.1 S1 RNA-binding domain-containing protein [Candidatus Atribacteria bacterium]
MENGERMELTHEDLGEIRIVRPGDLVKGKVIKKGEENYFVNINSKSEGLLPLREKMVGKEGEVENQLEEDDETWVVVTHIDEQGYVWLSREQARYQGAWIDIEESQNENKTLTAKVKKRVKGGLIVDVGINAFLPASCVDITPKNLDEFIDQTIPVKVIEADRKTKNVVVSRKAVLEEERERQKKELFDSLEVGQVRKGIVKNITKFGVFIDLGGVDGLLHVSEVSWKKTFGNLEDLFQKGEEIEVKVIAFDPEKEEISLSLKRLQPDPWEDIDEKIRPGDIVKGKVVSVRDFGVFVEIEEGLEGLIHISDLSWGYVKHPQEVVKVGSIVEARVLEIDKNKRRVSLGIKQVLPDPWEEVDEKYPLGSTVRLRVSSITPRGVWGEIEEGVEGRIPLEELSWKRVNRVSEIVRRNQVVEAKILEVDTQNRQILLSIRQLRPNPWEEIAGKWKVGDMVEAKVRRLMNFGAFVELVPDVEALLPLSELDWEPVKHPNQILKRGQTLSLKIIEFNPEEQRIVVSRKATLPDPWEEIKNSYPVGSVHLKKIVRLVDFGAFIELEKGWDGLVHISEISNQRISSPSEVLKEGEEVKVKVIKLDDQERKIGLSIKQASQEEEKDYASSNGKITLGDMVGGKLTDFLNSLKK